MEFQKLYQKAKEVTGTRKLSSYAEAGSVGSALLTAEGDVFRGVCIDTCCSMGFCAEHAAAAAMITSGQNRVKKMVAVGEDGTILPPCGRCREFIRQLHPDNLKTQVLLEENRVVFLEDLLPFCWEQD